MNEPLINFRPGISFSGKTYNKHPQWYNLPLRLSEEQLNDPLLVFNDFFQCYHLNETREVLWQWLTAIISSPGSISSEPLERSNQIYFYEKLEEVIEAAFFMRTNQHAARLNSTSKSDGNSTPLTQLETSASTDNILNKEKQLIEYVVDDPLYVIKTVFDSGRWCFIGVALKDWLDIALSSSHDAYCDPEDRQDLIIFNDHLLLVVEALFMHHFQNISDGIEKDRLQKTYTPNLLSSDQKAHPNQVFITFFKKYTSIYILRQFEDWLEAGIIHTGPWRNEITCSWHILDTYRDILCLIKCAEQLLKKDQSFHFNMKIENDR